MYKESWTEEVKSLEKDDLNIIIGKSNKKMGKRRKNFLIFDLNKSKLF